MRNVKKFNKTYIKKLKTWEKQKKRYGLNGGTQKPLQLQMLEKINRIISELNEIYYKIYESTKIPTEEKLLYLDNIGLLIKKLSTDGLKKGQMPEREMEQFLKESNK